MPTWKKFGAAEAERITGMDRETQRVKRRRGQLSPVVGGKARLDAVLLGEMMLIHKLARYQVVPKSIIPETLTARALAASWIAFWALRASGFSEKEAADMTKRPLEGPAPDFMITHHGDSHWKDTIFTADVSQALLDDPKPDGTVVSLKQLGEELSDRAGDLVETGV